MERGYLPVNETESAFVFLVCTPHPGSRVVEAEQERKERAGNLEWLEGCCHRFTYSTCSLAKRGLNMKSTACHMTSVTAGFYFTFKAKWHFKLLAFTNKHVSKTLQRADMFQISFNFWQRYIWLPLKEITQLAVPLFPDSVSAKSTSELVDKDPKLTLNDTVLMRFKSDPLGCVRTFSLSVILS